MYVALRGAETGSADQGGPYLYARMGHLAQPHTKNPLTMAITMDEGESRGRGPRSELGCADRANTSGARLRVGQRTAAHTTSTDLRTVELARLQHVLTDGLQDG